MDGSGTPFYAYDKATNQDMYVIHNAMSERLEKSQCNYVFGHLCCCAKENVACWMNSLYYTAENANVFKLPCPLRVHMQAAPRLSVLLWDGSVYISRVPRLMFITSCQQCFSSINPCTAGGKSKGHIKRGNRFYTDFCVLRKRISTNRD